MVAQIITNQSNFSIIATEVIVEDGFLKFKNASIDGGEEVEETWIPVLPIKCIAWKGKPWKEKKK